MNDNPTPPGLRVSIYLANWCDGFGLCFEFVIALTLSFSIPEVPESRHSSLAPIRG